jgi:hypothetical protein
MKSTARALGSAFFLVSVAILPTKSVRAATVEGFESTTLNSTNSIGDASIRTPNYFGINPTEGTHELLLTTISTAGSHDPGPTQSGTNAVSVSSLATFLGVATSSIRDGTATGTEGSAFKLDLGTVTAGSTITFNYDFLTNDQTPEAGGHNDFAFVTLTGNTGNTPVVADESTPQAPTTGANNPFVLETQYQTYTINITTTGNYVLGIGVVDATTTDTSSALLVDNISVNAGAAVPEPSTIALVVAGAASCLALRRRIRK